MLALPGPDDTAPKDILAIDRCQIVVEHLVLRVLGVREPAILEDVTNQPLRGFRCQPSARRSVTSSLFLPAIDLHHPHPRPSLGHASQAGLFHHGSQALRRVDESTK